MKTTIAICLLLILSGCKEKDNPVDHATREEDFSFPQSSRFAFILYSEQQSIKVGEAFDVKVILYNASDVFGLATELRYPTDKVSVETIVTGTYFSPSNDLLSLSKIDVDSGLVSYGITYKAGVTTLSGGSGIVCKIKCIATNAGTAVFTINSDKLRIDKSDGNSIQNFPQIVKENFSITIQ